MGASVVIAHLDGADAHRCRATTLLEESAREHLRMSVITEAELLVRPARVGVTDDVRSALAAQDLEIAGVAAVSGEQRARPRAETGLRTPDCCVLLEAERAGAALATFDVRLAAAA